MEENRLEEYADHEELDKMIEELDNYYMVKLKDKDLTNVFNWLKELRMYRAKGKLRD